MASKTRLALVTAAALAAVVGFEGNVFKVYRDPVGIPTVCAGIVTDMKPGTKVTPQWCQEMNREKVAEFAKFVIDHLPEGAPDSFYAAHTSLSYNIGMNAWLKSTARQKALQGDFKASCNAFTMWNRAGGKVLPGLVTRRAQERALCMSEL